MTQILCEPTYTTPSGESHYLDLVFTNPFIVDSCAVTDNLHGCDHQAVEVIFSITSQSAKRVSKEIYNFRDANFDLYLSDLSKIDWMTCFDGNVNSTWQNISNQLKRSISRTIPVKKVCIKHGTSQPWISKGIKKLCRKKRNLYLKAKQLGTFESWEAYKLSSALCKKEIRKAHRAYILGIAKDANHNLKKFWRFISSQRKTSNVTSFYFDDTLFTSANEISQNFMHFFASNGSQPYIPVDISNLDSSCDSSSASINFSSFTVDEVNNILLQLNTSKSAGPDGLLPIFLKLGRMVLSHVLCQFFNFSLLNRMVPLDWKMANVVPVYKGSPKPKAVASSYRPVSLTPIASKIMEKLICSRLMQFLDENNILGTNQFGFRPGRNCELMLSKVHHLISSSLDSSSCNLVDAVFLDFSSAFDRVPHNKLISKLHKLGIRGNILIWIQDFLWMRQQRVVFQGAFSDWKAIYSGVPQGSVLGPILFLAFVSDISCGVSSSIFQFADDHTIIRPITCEGDQDILQNDLKTVFQWSVDNELPLNVSKCAVMHISRCKPNNALFCDYFLGNNPLTVTENYELLGVLFSSNFSFSNHFDHICKSASRLVGFVSRCTNGMLHDSFLLLYKTLVLPVLLYCGSVWHPSNVCHLNRLEAVQRRATRILYRRKFPNDNVSYEDRLKHFNIISIKHNLALQRLALGHKVVHGHSPADFNQFIRLSNHAPGRLLHWTARTQAFFNSPFVHFTRLWNDLPLDLQEIPSVQCFRKRLSEHYLSTY